MCVSPETTHLPVDSPDGCICQTTVGGKEISIPLAGFEIRREGRKLVFLDQSDEAIAKIAYGDDGVWYSLGAPAKITLPNGENILCNAPSLQ